jgi:hypothetical protein
MAADYVKFNRTEFELMGGYLSPVSDLYKKAGLASSQHRYDGIVVFRNFTDIYAGFECANLQQTKLRIG